DGGATGAACLSAAHRSTDEAGAGVSQDAIARPGRAGMDAVAGGADGPGAARRAGDRAADSRLNVARLALTGAVGVAAHAVDAEQRCALVRARARGAVCLATEALMTGVALVADDAVAVAGARGQARARATHVRRAAGGGERAVPGAVAAGRRRCHAA